MEDTASADAEEAKGDYSDGKEIADAKPKAEATGNVALQTNGVRRSTLTRPLTEQDMREINARLLQEAEHAAPLRADSDSDPTTGAETPENGLVGHSTAGGTTAAAATPKIEQGKSGVDLSKIKGCARRLKQHFMASLPFLYVYHV